MAKQYSTLTKELLQTLFEYKEGELYWKTLKIKNQVKVGDKAGYIDDINKYKSVSINNTCFLLHKIIYIYHYGYCPKFIDHINGIRNDNRIENLRPATSSQNAQNAKKRKDNTTGVKGINFCKRDKRFVARVQSNGKRYLLGYFKTLEEAKLEVIKARETYHKEYANNG